MSDPDSICAAYLRRIHILVDKCRIWIESGFISVWFHCLAESYDVLTNGYVALRGTFLIDQVGKVVHQVVNDLPLGRNIEEVLRMTNALLFTQKNGEVCPANWNKGKDGMKANVESVADYLAKYAHTL